MGLLEKFIQGRRQPIQEEVQVDTYSPNDAERLLEELTQQVKEREIILREIEHTRALPYAEVIRSFFSQAQRNSSFFIALDEVNPASAPHSPDHLPVRFNISTIPNDQGIAYDIHYESALGGPHLQISEVKMGEEKQGDHNQTMALAVVSVTEKDSFYSHPFAFYQERPDVGYVEQDPILAFQRAAAFFQRVFEGNSATSAPVTLPS